MLGFTIGRFWVDDRRWIRNTARAVFIVLTFFYSTLVHANVAWRGSDEKNYRWTLKFGKPDFAVYRLGIILLKTGRAAESLPYFAQLHQDYPDNPDYGNTLALALWHTGKRRDAVHALQDLVKERPDYTAAAENLRWMRRQIPP